MVESDCLLPRFVPKSRGKEAEVMGPVLQQGLGWTDRCFWSWRGSSVSIAGEETQAEELKGRQVTSGIMSQLDWGRAQLLIGVLVVFAAFTSPVACYQVLEKTHPSF